MCPEKVSKPMPFFRARQMGSIRRSKTDQAHAVHDAHFAHYSLRGCRVSTSGGQHASLAWCCIWRADEVLERRGKLMRLLNKTGARCDRG